MKIATKIFIYTLTILIVTTLISTLFFLKEQRRLADIRLNEYSSKIALVLTETIAGDLWNVNVENVNKVAKAVFLNEDIYYLSIKDTYGQVNIFLTKKDYEKVPLFIRENKIFYENKLVGTLVIKFYNNSYERKLTETKQAIILFLIALILLMAFVSIWVAISITRPIKEIVSALQKVKEGAFDLRFETTTNDEFNTIKQHFNDMNESIESEIKTRILKEDEVVSLNATLEHKVIERTMQLENVNSELESFSYSISHDLRAPLRAVEGFARFLFDDYKDKLDGEGLRYIEVIRANTKKMDRLITDLLALARVSKTTLTYSTVDMYKLAGDIYREAVGGAVLMDFEFSLGSIPQAWGHPSLIQQVWANLISNAIKYSMKSPVKKIEIGSYTENNEQVYYVKDTGIGFNPEYIDKLFGVFQRLHTDHDFEGTGIGLSIVRRIIQRHQGRVWAEGKENEGAAFYFSLPLQPDMK